MFKKIKRFVGKHKFEYLITFFVFTNLFPAWFPQFMYYIAFALIFIIRKTKCYRTAKRNVYFRKTKCIYKYLPSLKQIKGIIKLF